MLTCQRHLFDIPDNVHYFNCAYMSPLLSSAAAAGHDSVDAKQHPWEITSELFFSLAQESRQLFARMINAGADDIAIIPAVSYGSSVAMKNLPLQSGDEVLVLAEEFPSNVYAWREACRAADASIVTVARPEHGDWTRAVLDALGPQVRVAVLTHTHWVDGGLLDLTALSKAFHDNDIRLVLDLTQSLGVVTIDVEEIKPDFLMCTCYKWLMGPYSLGFLYAAPQYHSGVPLEHGWLNRPGAEDFSRLFDYVDRPHATAARFDVGERSNFALHPIAIDAMRQINAWGMPNIAARTLDLTSRIEQGLIELGFIASDRSLRAPHYLGVHHPSGLRSDTLEKLAAEKIYISKRGDRLRITPHVYNNQNDIDVLVHALASCITS